MTEAEAILELKEYAENSWGGLNESFELAIKALEKQIAKKPIFNTWSPVKCPTCGCDLNKSIGDGYYQRCIPMKFCECGQKLDWSEV